MTNRLSVSRCCCEEEQGEYIYSGDAGGLVLFNYVTTGNHLVQLGTTAAIDDTAGGLWTGRGAMFGISNLPIARSTTIVSAYVQFTVSSTQSDTPFLCFVRGDRAAHSTPQINFYVYDANKTNEYVEWSQTGVTWNTGGYIVTPSITAVVQEIVNDSRWNSGQCMMVYIEPSNGWRDINLYNAELVVTY